MEPKEAGKWAHRGSPTGKVFGAVLFAAILGLLLFSLFGGKGRAVPGWKFGSEAAVEEVLCQQLELPQISSYAACEEGGVRAFSVPEGESLNCVVFVRSRLLDLFWVGTITEVPVEELPATFAQTVYGGDCIVKLGENEIDLLWEQEDGIYR